MSVSMNHDDILRTSINYRRTGNEKQERTFLLQTYIAHPDIIYVRERLKELGEIRDPLLLAKPHTIFECEWREGLAASLHMMCTRIEWCMKQGYYFSLQNPLGFGYWTDYFKPFWSEEEKNSIYSLHLPITKVQPRLSIYRTHIAGFRQKNGGNIYMREIFEFIIMHIFQLRSDIMAEVEQLIRSLNLPEQYTAVHIRRGDRSNHRNCPCKVPTEQYVEAIRKINPGVQNLFVTTDDFRVIEEMNKHFNVISLTKPEQQGFNDPVFFRTPHTEKKQTFLQLFAEIFVVARSQYFVGTYCSVLSHLMQVQRPEKTKNSILLY